ncbi:MAG: tyrosine--tRNA ligase [Anaerolineae bacterium]|nr:tyrosine--tRNA ligase [Anaerolineae bacterium]
MKTIFDELKWRGLIHSFTEGLPELLAREKVTVYIGFDPTSDSLQVGNLLALMVLARMQRYGHTPIALAGGGTGMIGDPGGKKSERQLLTPEQIEVNVQAIKGQLAHFLDFDVKGNPAKIINNADWLNTISMMDFLRNVGKNFTVNYMIAKDSVKSRLDRENGISYTEFSYMLLQAYDFLQLFDNHNCTLQSGGSDQWGNITAGVELIRKVRNGSAYGLVYPLVSSADGIKLGKTESGAIWLSAERTSPYRFYQFWFNQTDDVVIDYLKYFTWFELDEIEELAQKLAHNPEARDAQRALAEEMTRLVHGETALHNAVQASEALFGGDITGLSSSDIQDIFADVPSTEIAKGKFGGQGMPIAELLVETKVAKSKGEARRSIRGGGININNVRLVDEERMVRLPDCIEGKYLVLRKGKRHYHLVKVVA